MVLTQKFYCIFPYHHTTTGENLKMIVYFSLELWFIKVVKLDVCGRLVLSNSVTIIDTLATIGPATPTKHAMPLQ